jgi:hypothetical protein
MGLAQNPGVVTNGLVFYYDMSNTKKSWIGEPTTNQFAIPTPNSNGDVSFSVNGTGTFKRIYSGSYGGYDIQPTDIVYRYDLGTNGCHYHGNDVTITAGQYPTFTFDYYLSQDVTSFGDTYMANFENLGSGVGGSAGLPNLQKGVWQTIQINGSIATATSGLRMLLYPGGCSGGRLAATGYLLMKNPQVTFSSSSGRVLPFVAGTRSNTQALLDLTNRSTMTAQNLTYNSDNTFNFTYSNPSYITIPLSTAFNKTEGTMDFWVYPTRYNGGNGYFVNREDSTANAVDWFWIGPYSDYFYFRIGNGSDCCSNDLSFGAGAQSVIPLNTWTNMCFTWKINSTSAIYKNGILYTSRNIGNIPSTNPASNGRIGLGHANADDYFNGKMPSVSIYNRQLGPSEVYQNFSAKRGIYGI